jgi:hypothetical protein
MVLASAQTVTGAKTFNAGKLLDKGEIVFDVKAYGAVGNGSTDDTAAIQSAIDAANTAGGGVVWFPKGTYKLVTNPLKLYSGATPTIIPYSNITLRGVGADGINGTQIVQTTTGVDVIKGLNDAANGAQALNNRILDLAVAWGTATLTNSGNGIYLAQQAADGPSFQQWEIRNVSAINFQGSGKWGFNFESMITSTVQNCQANSCANGFLWNGAVSGDFSSVSTSVVVSNCYANMSTNGVVGFKTLDNTYMTFNGCAVDYGVNSAGPAYLIDTSNCVSLIGCGIELNGTVTLTNGIKLNAATQVGIYNNYGFQGKTGTYVYATGTSTGITIVGYQVNSNVSGTTGLAIDAGSSVTEIDCDFSGANAPYSINAAGAWYKPGHTRFASTASSATPSINCNAVDTYAITALAAAITSATVTGTPEPGQLLHIAITGTATRAIALGSSFEAGPAALPTTTSGTARLDCLFKYNSVTSKWRCMASG